jgi:hypothetical protein
MFVVDIGIECFLAKAPPPLPTTGILENGLLEK